MAGGTWVSAEPAGPSTLLEGGRSHEAPPGVKVPISWVVDSDVAVGEPAHRAWGQGSRRLAAEIWVVGCCLLLLFFCPQ